MAHQSLYRAYRPQSFDDVVGQRHITQTLRNAVAEGTVAHAYLFTGPRGTGKTTTARILAKALNCSKGMSPDPDVSCQDCIDIAEGRHPDVYELDAASRTQVDIVRSEIIDRLAYAPTRGTWKVYIIDEVHMLSNHSFNALLKSIEEPPSHTIFVLCTTHPHKVPETIHSRCQRFDFHRIGIEDIVGRLAHICEREGITVAEGALSLIAKHAGGGMRDAITTLEQLCAFTGKNIALDDVEGLLGEVDVALLLEFADVVLRRDIAAGFRFVARLAESGTDMTEFVRDFTGHVRDLYVTAVVGDASGIVDTTSEQLARLTSQAAGFGVTRLARILDLLGVLAGEIRWSSDPRLTLEVALTRMARPDGDLTLDALVERIEALESGVAIATARPAPTIAPTVDPPVAAPPIAQSSAAETPKVPPASTASPAAPGVEDSAEVERGDAGPIDRAHVKRAWPAVVAEIKRAKSTRAHIFANTEVDVDSDGVTLVVEFPSDGKFTMELAGSPDTRPLLTAALGKVLGAIPPVRYQLGRGAVQPAPKPAPEVTRAPESPPEAPDTPAPVSASVPPMEPEPESAPALPAQDSEQRVDEAAIERMLMTELGAEMVAEHPHTTDEGDEAS
ncbi:MAG: DNA polymerase III subunit gamma/tau [Coriobacteriia bacterium]|nr:DNA polymerase III subunit gamma/tau [Coriobacteriia bacterium]